MDLMIILDTSKSVDSQLDAEKSFVSDLIEAFPEDEFKVLILMI